LPARAALPVNRAHLFVAHGAPLAAVESAGACGGRPA
jgi:hypothetical protein